MKRLETDLGFVLLERHGRGGVRLTAEGRVAYTYCTRMLDLADGMRKTLDAMQRGTLGALQVGATVTAQIYLLPGLIDDFTRLYPQVRVEATGGSRPELLSALEQGRIDLAVVWGPLDPQAWEQVWLADDEFVAVALPTHPLAGRPSVAPGELDDYPVLLSATRGFIAERLRRTGARLQHAVQFGTPAAIKEAVLAGMGIGMLSPHAVHYELQSGKLARLPLSGIDLSLRLLAAYPREARLSPPAMHFIAHLRRGLFRPAARRSGDAAPRHSRIRRRATAEP